MVDGSVLRIIYTFFLGLLLAVFIGVGVNTFYEPPEMPRYPAELETYSKEVTDEQAAKLRAFDAENREYQDKLKPYNRDVSVITLVAAVTLLVVSIVFQRRIRIIADGIMLGGLFTLVYSIGRGFASEDSKYLFVVVTIGLAIALYLGYRRFVHGKPHSVLV